MFRKGVDKIDRMKLDVRHHKYSSVWITKGELDSLFLLLRIRYLTQHQFYRVYCSMSDEPISKYAFHNRLRKFENVNLINRYYVGADKSAVRYHYLSVGQIGYEALEDYDYPLEFLTPINYQHKRGANRDHDLAAREMLVHFIDFWHKDDREESLVVHQPSYYLKKAKKLAISSVVPDALFSVGKQFIAIELDRETESLSELVEKNRKLCLFYRFLSK